MIKASPTAQRLVLAYKHFGADPYEMYNAARRVQVCHVCTRVRARVDRSVFCDGTVTNPHPPSPWRRAELPVHPRPVMYRAFLLAAAVWIESNQADALSARMFGAL